MSVSAFVSECMSFSTIPIRMRGLCLCSTAARIIIAIYLHSFRSCLPNFFTSKMIQCTACTRRFQLIVIDGMVVNQITIEHHPFRHNKIDHHSFTHSYIDVTVCSWAVIRKNRTELMGIEWLLCFFVSFHSLRFVFDHTWWRWCTATNHQLTFNLKKTKQNREREEEGE